MQEPSPSLEERIRAGTGMASSNTRDAKKNQKEQHHPDAMELSQSTKGRHETMLWPKRSVQMESWECLPNLMKAKGFFSNHSPECIEALIVLQGLAEALLPWSCFSLHYDGRKIPHVLLPM